jgi:hypothetical protein
MSLSSRFATSILADAELISSLLISGHIALLRFIDFQPSRQPFFAIAGFRAQRRRLRAYDTPRREYVMRRQIVARDASARTPRLRQRHSRLPTRAY